MEQRLLRFIDVLRKHDVRVSTAETLDAMQTAAAVGYDDRELLSGALSSALAKTADDKPTFDHCFELFFGLPDRDQSGAKADEAADSTADTGNDAPPEEPAAAPAATDAEVAALLDNPELEPLLNTSEDQLGVALEQAATEANLDDMRFNTQRGLFGRRMQDAMGMQTLERTISALRELETDQGDAAVNWLQARRQYLQSSVRDFVDRRLLMNANYEGRQIREQALRSARLSALERHQLKDVSELVRKLARKIASKHRRRMHRDKRGRLDVGKTLRRSLGHGGVPFKLYWKKVKRDQPELYVLCDISGSVATYSRFLLLFLYSLNDVVPKIRSFVFSNHIAETTELFDNEPPEKAIETAWQKWGLGSSDYRNSLAGFNELCGDRIGHNATIIILGDGRNNYGDPGLEIMQSLYHKARLVLWFNPESQSSWGTGDSEIKRYQTACHAVAECNSLAKLERLIDQLLRTVH